MTKKCNKCKKILTHNQFYKSKKGKYGLHGQCKNCRNEIIQIYRQINRDKILKSMKKYRQNNKDKIKECNKNYYQNNKPKFKEYFKKYRTKHLKESREYFREYNERRRKNPKHRLTHRMGHAIQKSLKSQNISKRQKPWESLVSFTLKDLMNHLKNQFQPGMTWENIGKWHIDHIKPISLFEFKNVDDLGFKECWDLNNLQPLWAKDNFRKGNKYNEF